VSEWKDVIVGRFTDDYKRQAVDLVASSGRSIGSVAKELGLRDPFCGAGWSNVGFVHHRQYATLQEAARDIFAYIEGFYNRTRRHSAIGYISPIEMELKAA
jgi:transposase InsO family protein